MGRACVSYLVLDRSDVVHVLLALKEELYQYCELPLIVEGFQRSRQQFCGLFPSHLHERDSNKSCGSLQRHAGDLP